MSRRRSPARLVIALSVAAVLVIFLMYTAFAGAGVPEVSPAQLAAHEGQRVSLLGSVVGPVKGNAEQAGLRFRVRQIGGKASVPVVYTGSVPDLFRVGRHIVVDGRLDGRGRFVAVRDSLVTKCPSKYQAAPPKQA
ncbi:MAG: cytochrome c maturation protein CcmE [Gaiellaceae bacterium]